MATMDWVSDWSEHAVITTNNENEGTWYTATASVQSSAFSYSYPRGKEWIADQWVDMTEDKFSIELEEKDHLAELEELFEI